MGSAQGETRGSSPPPATEKLPASAQASPTQSRPVSPSSSAEKPVRQQLKKTTIEEKGEQIAPQTTSEDPKETATRRAAPKRDHGTLATDAPEEENGNARKREKPEEIDAGKGSAQENIHKRPRDDDDDGNSSPSDGTQNSPKRRSLEVQREAAPDPETTATKSSSGFGNNSAQSPFASLPKSKSPEPSSQTSASAFAASGFASFASSSASPFASSAQKPQNPADKLNGTTTAKPSFASMSGNAASPFATKTASGSVFGAPLKGFGGSTSGSGKLGSVFSSSSGSAFGAPLASAKSSFASASTDSKSETKTIQAAVKPFGAPAEHDKDAEEDDEAGDETGDNEADTEAEAEAVVGERNDQKDERFYEQEVHTGEEDEDTRLSAFVRLYILESGAWKERGVGNFKLNTRKDDASKARVVMRARGSQKLVLNSPLIPDCAPVLQEAMPNRMLLTAIDVTDANKPKTFLLRVKTPKECDEIYNSIVAAMKVN